MVEDRNTVHNPDHENVVCMNPLGPHFYVDDSRPFEFPESWRDAVTDRMNQMITRLDEEHGWPITHSRIKGHEPITKIVWDDDGFEIKPFEVNEDWYSREEIHDYDF